MNRDAEFGNVVDPTPRDANEMCDFGRQEVKEAITPHFRRF